MGEKKIPPQEAKKNSAPLAPALFPKTSNWRKTGSKTLGGLEGGGRVLGSNRLPPLG